MDQVHLPRIHTIIQLSPQGEGSSHPPDPYFPNVLSTPWTINPERGSTTSHPGLIVQSIKQKRYSRANCTKTTFLINRPTALSALRESAAYEVVHLLFDSWPAKSVPNSDAHQALRELMTIAYAVNTRPQYTPDGNLIEGEYDPPIVLHCAEGGRTGTFMAINSLLRSYKCIQSPYDNTHVAPRMPSSPLGPPPSEIALDPVLRELDHLLDQRPNMIDNENQVRFFNFGSPSFTFCQRGVLICHPLLYFKSSDSSIRCYTTGLRNANISSNLFILPYLPSRRSQPHPAFLENQAILGHAKVDCKYRSQTMFLLLLYAFPPNAHFACAEYRTVENVWNAILGR